MVEITLIKYLLSDDASLNSYLKGDIITQDEYSNRLLLLTKNFDRNIPDHYYRLVLELNISKEKNIGNIIAKSFSIISNEFLRIDSSNQIFVKKDKQNIWQQILPLIPPLILQSSFLYTNSKTPNFLNPNDVKDYYNKYLIPNFKYTSIPQATSSFLDIRSHKLNDLHIHLNGSTETDIVWQDFLTFPSKIYRELNIARKKYRHVSEQLEQESQLLNPKKFYNLLKIARKLRHLLYDLCITKNVSNYGSNSFSQLMENILYIDDRKIGSVSKHPFRLLLPYSEQKKGVQMGIESLMHLVVLKEIENGKNNFISYVYHFYLLIYGLSNRLLVQQLHQYGFEQFQKFTLNNLRNITETSFDTRFFQVFGNQLNNTKVIEGRFSPKLSKTENLLYINQILKGWNIFQSKYSQNTEKKFPELSLIAHFIKRADHNINSSVRHRELRIDLWKRAKVLISLINKTKYKNVIVGIDAAANELDAPPEVFAPIFNRCRSTGIRNITYHVGEDFFHPISGLRAVYETIIFIGLEKFNRIGHGTALGIDSKYWYSVIGKVIPIKKGELLDNIIFILYLKKRKKIYLEPNLENKLIEKLNELTLDIYKSIFPLSVHFQSWLLRKYCPILLLSNSLSEARRSGVFNEEDYNVIKSKNIKSNVLNLIKKYHETETRKIYNEPLLFDVSTIFDSDFIEQIQIVLLNILYRKKIIIETLPTSNVRISCAKDFSKYHFLNWEQWRKKKLNIPQIVVGTDDTGIFATNLRNEFACISELVGDKPNRLISRLIRNSEKFRFK